MAPAGERDPDTRRRVVEAAIQCILENGFYRASTNAIAERAGLSWGVIQYWFGTRESLMLAVLEEGTERLRHILEDHHVIGDTAADRVKSYFDILAAYYADPAWLAFMQVLLNLSHDPATSQRSVEMMAAMNASARPLFERLASELFAGAHTPDPALAEFAFHAVRGLAMSQLMLSVNPPDGRPAGTTDFGAMKTLLARSLAQVIDDH